MIYVKTELKEAHNQFDHFKVKPSNLGEDGTPVAENTLNIDKDIDQ